MSDILCEVKNRIAFVTLNRPTALNALSLDMVQALHTLLRDCAADTAVAALLLRGAGEKAFCAGGDIRALYASARSGGRIHEEFFPAEYRLDYFLHRYPKPIIAAIDGITMGGGMGLAQGASLRIAGERTRIAMPEVGIGLFPDVGASFFLSRLPGALGPYLALTGALLRPADALYSGLADCYLAPDDMPRLATALEALAWSDSGVIEDLDRTIRAFATDPPPSPAPLAALRPAIDLHFGRATVPAILESLRGETRADYAEWAGQTSTLLMKRSPTMLAVALRELQRGRTLGLADCFRMEAGMVRRSLEQGDFLEGIRALLIDKDNAPKWRPDRIEAVSEASVEAFFLDPWAGGPHPLADLEADD